MTITYKGHNLHQIGNHWTFTRLNQPVPVGIDWGDPVADSLKAAMEHIELLEAYQEGMYAFRRERPNLSFEPNVLVPSSLHPDQAAQWLAGWMGAFQEAKASRACP